MTDPIQDLDKELKMAEIRKINAEISKIETETQANLAMSMATSAKLNAETAKLNKETKYYPLVFLLTGMAGGVAVALIQALIK